MEYQTKYTCPHCNQTFLLNEKVNYDVTCKCCGNVRHQVFYI